MEKYTVLGILLIIIILIGGFLYTKIVINETSKQLTQKIIDIVEIQDSEEMATVFVERFNERFPDTFIEIRIGEEGSLGSDINFNN